MLGIDVSDEATIEKTAKKEKARLLFHYKHSFVVAGPLGFEPRTFSYLHTQQGDRRLTRYPCWLSVHSCAAHSQLSVLRHGPFFK
jgi:hypothetical protein